MGGEAISPTAEEDQEPVTNEKVQKQKQPKQPNKKKVL
jgi:hypothetical protein